MLKDLISAQWRKRVYVTFAVVGILIGATQVGFASAGLALPVAVIVAKGIYAYLGVAVGAVAASNVAPRKPEDAI